MNERYADFNDLQAFSREGDDHAFSVLVRRHLDLVYGTALRKVADVGVAEEIAQNVFCALARKAWQFAPEDSLPAWLHKSTLLECKEWLRGELRRRRREQAAAQLGTTMNAPDEQTALRALVPLLDDGLLSLREKDRIALLLRYQESRSLREVAATLGVREDAAQKRVASALTKLSQFFQRRGFKTATAALTATALEQTAASASAATAAGVIHAALQVGSPTLFGLSVIARLASMSKLQLAATCLALAVLPLGWESHQWRSAEAALGSSQSDLNAIQAQQSALDTEIRQLTERSARLGASPPPALQVAAGDALRNFALWKARIRAALTNDNYRWPEDSPFVRIPKTAVRDMELPAPVESPGVVTSAGRELLGLAPQERTAVEEQLRIHFAEFDRLSDAAIYETNQPTMGMPPSATASKTFCLPALGEAVRADCDQLVGELKSVLGEQRWALLEPALKDPGTYSVRRLLGFASEDSSQEASAWITEKGSNLLFGYQWYSKGSSFRTDGALLASLLGDLNPDAEQSLVSSLQQHNLPGPLTTRLLDWLRFQAESRLRKAAQP